MANEYPLKWPIGWPRTKKVTHSRFIDKSGQRPSISKAMRQLIYELCMLNDVNEIEFTVSTNIPYRKSDGLPYSNARDPEDTGVAVYFKYNKQDMVIACDTFNRVGCNIYAIAKTIEAMRGIERWGCSELLQRAFSGFTALPAPGQSVVKAWWDILNVPINATQDEIKSHFRNLSKILHPDIPETGDAIKFAELQGAYQQALNAAK